MLLNPFKVCLKYGMVALRSCAHRTLDVSVDVAPDIINVLPPVGEDVNVDISTHINAEQS